MKKIALYAAAIVLNAGSARAAVAQPPPPPPPPPLWTGFYVGLNAGGTWSDRNNITLSAFPALPDPLATNVYTVNGVTDTLGADLLSSTTAALSAFRNSGGASSGGFIGGGQIGYNWQFYNSFVAGIEADIQGIASSHSASNGFGAAIDPSPEFGPLLSPFVTISNVQRNLDYLGTVRGRLGWLVTPTLLIYGTGGLAYGGVHLNTSLATFNLGVGAGVPVPASTLLGPGFGAASFADTRVGWSAGGGVEWMFWPNWSAKGEYLYYDLGSVTTNSIVVGSTNGGNTIWAYGIKACASFSGHIVRAGVNYHFNWGAP